MLNEAVLNQIHRGLVVSCQARKGWAMYGSDIMAAFADAAKRGGAVGIRATEPENIQAIRNRVDLPIIGIYKQWYTGYDVYITPTLASAKAVAEAGAKIVAVDGTKRIRPQGESLTAIVSEMHQLYPDVMIMADVDSVISAQYAIDCGVDLVSSTLAGYTDETKGNSVFQPKLVHEMAQLGVPVIAEGHIHTHEELQSAYTAGAYSVVIGTAITRPEIITQGFVEALEK